MKKTKFAAALFVITVAAAPVGAGAGPTEDAVMNTDRAFSAMAQQKGVAAAFAAYAAPNAITFEQQPEPVRGPQAILKFTQDEFADGSKLAWVPREATTSKDGTMATTWGRWTFSAKDEKGQPVTLAGSYLTVWQKQADGSWKYTQDMAQNDEEDEPDEPATPPKPGH